MALLRWAEQPGFAMADLMSDLGPDHAAPDYVWRADGRDGRRYTITQVDVPGWPWLVHVNEGGKGGGWKVATLAEAKQRAEDYEASFDGR